MAKQNLKDKSYHYIREKIVNCEFMPGDFLVESQLIQELGASRTPIREALNKLEQENLVRILPKRGVQVCDITMAGVNQVFEIRRLVEPYTIRAYGAAIPADKLKTARALLVAEPYQYAAHSYEADNDLHQLLIQASRNQYIISLMDTIYTQNHRLRILSGQKVESRLAETQAEHLNIVDAMLAGDFEAAATHMVSHLENSRAAAVGAMLGHNDAAVLL